MDKPTCSTSDRHVKRKAVEKLSGAARRKIHRDDTRMADAKTCQKYSFYSFYVKSAKVIIYYIVNYLMSEEIKYVLLSNVFLIYLAPL
jgi:hypothetical protein